MASKNAEISEFDYSDDDHLGATGFTAMIDEDGTKHSVSTYEETSPKPVYNQYNIDKVENLNFGVPGAPLSPQTIRNRDAVHQKTAIANQEDQPLATRHQKISTSTIKPKEGFFQKLINIGKDTTSELRSKLRQFYNEATIPCIPWLNEGRDLVMSEYYTELQLDTSDVKIPLENIFKNIDKKNPRILIEGQPGYGKTTLVIKLLYDWALSKSYIKHFKLVFLIPLRELQRRNVITVIADIARRCGCSDIDKINGTIQKYMSKILLVFDGLDELSVNERMPILEILYGQEFIDATVIVTSRTGLFTLQHDEKVILSAGLSKRKEFYDRRINVLGIRIEDRESFLLKFVSPDTIAIIMESIQQLSESATIMFGSPLFLILLAFMASKTSDLTSSRTKTQLFKGLFNYLVNHSVIKKSNRLDEEIDLFQIDLPINRVQKTIQKFGELSLSHIRSNNLQFEHNKLTTKVYNMGFLINHKEISTFESKCNYEAFHLTILEFAAAFSIWMNYKEKGPINSFDCILPLYLELGKTSLVFSFLVGLLQEDADKLFQHLLPCAHVFATSCDNLWYLLHDYGENNCLDKLLPILVNFISPHINHREKTLFSFYRSHLYTEILKIGIQSGKVKMISINFENPVSLPNDIVLPRLLIDAVAFERLNQSSWLSETKCETMTIRLQTTSVTFWEVKSIFSSLLHDLSSRASKSFSIKVFSSRRFETPTTFEPFFDSIKNIQFDKFIMNDNPDFGSEILTDLLRRNQIESFELKNNPETILDLVINSSKLKSLHITSQSDVEIDLYNLTKGGEKNYFLLSVDTKRVICKKPLSNKNCIHCLIINPKCPNTEILNEINPVVLQCNVSTLIQLSPAWTGYLSLKELFIWFDISINKVDLWKRLLCCKNLSILELNFKHNDTDILELSTTTVKVISCLQELPIQTFVIRDYTCHNLITRKLCEGIASYLMESRDVVKYYPFNIEIFVVNFNDDDSDSDKNTIAIVKILVECLKQNRLDSVRLISYDNVLGHYLTQIIDYSLYSVSYLIYGSSNNDPTYRQIEYDANTFSFIFRPTICLEIKLNSNNV